MSFKQLITEVRQSLTEKQKLNEVQVQLAIGKDTQFGNVVILAGGAGSGKGFVLSRAFNIEGKVFDVDNLKKQVLDFKRIQDILCKMLNLKDFSEFSLKNPDHVYAIHTVVDEMGLENLQKSYFFRNSFPSLFKNGDVNKLTREQGTKISERLPNVFFDVTAKNLKKISLISQMVMEAGYSFDKIHLVWILNDINVAIEQNMARSRQVPMDILKQTHVGAGETMISLLKDTELMNKYVGGSVAIVFNKVNVDSTLVKSPAGGSYLSKLNYVMLRGPKDHGSLNMSKMTDKVIAKINDYIPDEVSY